MRKMSGSPLVHLGANVYLHGRRHQDRWLSRYLGPTLDNLRNAGSPIRFWFDRDDARGPTYSSYSPFRSLSRANSVPYYLSFSTTPL